MRDGDPRGLIEGGKRATAIHDRLLLSICQINTVQTRLTHSQLRSGIMVVRYIVACARRPFYALPQTYRRVHDANPDASGPCAVP